MSYEEAFNLITKESGLNMLDKDVVKCFGLSKMTIYNDITERARYAKLLFVEMLEYIARIAVMNVKDNPRLRREPLD